MDPDSLPMPDALERVTGATPYLDNLQLPGMLTARVLRSRVPHAELTSIESSKAARMPGVVAVLTGADFQGESARSIHYGTIKLDQPVIALDRIRFLGEPLAVVAAEEPEVAEAALEAISLSYRELPAVFTPLEAIEEGAPQLHTDTSGNLFTHAKLRHGDLAGGFEAADEQIEEVYTSPVAQHASLEPHVSIARWQGDQLTIWTAAQAPYVVRRVLAKLFDLKQEDVRVIVPPLGGGYGGKGHVKIEPLVALIARQVPGRPVKLSLSRAEEFFTVTKHPAHIRIRSGFTHDGRLTARHVTLHWGGGAYADISPALVRSGMVRAIGPYRIPAVQVDSYGVYTNLPPAGAFRGAMSSQTTWAYESHTDSIAARLGMDPLELRKRNLLREGDEFATGETLHDVHYEECLQSVVNALGPPVDTPRPPHLRRGRGMAVMMKSTIATSRSECRLRLERDGSLKLFTSTVEMGQGAHSALAQLAAEGLGLPRASVKVIGPDTDQTPFDTTTSASRATSVMGAAVQDAAAALQSRLLEAAEPLLETRAESLRIESGQVRATEGAAAIGFAEILKRHGLSSLEVEGAAETQGGLDPETGQGLASPHWHQGAGACEVEVDMETGKVRVLRYYSASYAGRVVRRQLASLQNDGNVVFGLGPAMFEQVVFDHGQPINPNLSDYMIPSFVDIPETLENTLIEREDGEIHGIGEMTLPPVAPAIANAIYDAIGVRIRDLPITPERVLSAIVE